MTAEEAAMIMMSGGTNTGGDIIDKIIALPVRQGGNFGSGADGYHYMLHYGSIEGEEVVAIYKYNTSASGNGEIAYAVQAKIKPAYFWFVLYKNIDDSVVFAAAMSNSQVTVSSYSNTLDEFYDYSTRANGDVIEWYLYEHIKRNIAGVENAVITPRGGHHEFEITFKVHYVDVHTYYNWETGNIENQAGITGEFTIPSGTFAIPSAFPSAAFYTNLSAAEYEQEMVNLFEILDQTID